MDSGPTTRELTTAMAAGDEAAIERFYREFFDTMFLEARTASCRDEQFSLDVVQDAMLKMIRHIKPMETQAQLAQWTRRVIRNVAYDQLRSEIRRRHREARSVAYRASDPAADELQEMEAQVQWLAAELAAMPASESHLLCARYQWGWTLQRIGRELGISAGAVDGRIRRLLAGLRRNFGKRQNDE